MKNSFNLHNGTTKIYKRMKKKLLLILYYCIVRHLPATYFPLGMFFNTVRVAVLRGLMEIGDDTRVQPGFKFGQRDVIVIGHHCQVNENVYIQSALIGNHVMIAQQVAILAVTHNFDRFDVPIILQGSTGVRPVTIKDDVWIGRNAVIMPGITIENGVIVGAGAVVTKNIPAYAIVGGVPAKIIRYRNIEKLIPQNE